MAESFVSLVVLGVGGLALVVFIVASIVLNYHFTHYGFTKIERIGIPMTVYYFVSGAFFLALLLIGVFVL